MKASVIAASIASLIALTPAVVLANPTELNITVFCPSNDDNDRTLRHHGDYIAGKGQKIIQGIGGDEVIFKSNQLAPNTPSDLSDYRNDKVKYDPTTGEVSCVFTKYSNPTEPQVTVSYTLTNGKGGIVTSQAYNHVMINLPVGLR